MPDPAQNATASYCTPRKAALRLDCQEFCDRGRTRAELAERLGVSESLLTKWLAPSSDREMPETMIRRWMRITGSMRLLYLMNEEFGIEVMDRRHQVLFALMERAIESGCKVVAS